MATLYTVAVGGIVKADDLNQIVLALTAGTVPIAITLVNDASSPALEVRNAGAGGAVTIRDQAGNPAFVINSSGITAAVVPSSTTLYTLVGLTATQTITNKTLTNAILNGIIKLTAGTFSFLKHADVTVAGSTISITGHGNYAKCTTDNLATEVDTLTYTNATYIQAGTPLVLEFSGKLKIKATGNIKVNGWFVAQAGARLHLIYDGTYWNEVGRTGDVQVTSRFTKASGTQSLVHDTEATIGVDTEDTTLSGVSGLFTNTSGTITPLIPGLYEISGHAQITNTDKNGIRRAWIDIDNVLYEELAGVGVSDSTSDDTTLPFPVVRAVFDGSNTFRIRLKQNSGSSLNMNSGEATVITVSKVGP